MSRRASASKPVSLKSQVLGAVGLILLLFAIVLGGYLYFSEVYPGQGAMTSQPALPLGRIASEMKMSLLNAQNSAHLFLLNQDNALAEKHKTQVAELLALAKQLNNAASKTGNRAVASASQQIISQVPPFADTFQKLASASLSRGTDNSSGLLGQLRTSGREFYTLVSRNEAGSLALGLLQVKIFQDEYFKNNKAQSLQDLTVALQDLYTVANNSNIDPLESQLLKKSIRNYKASLDRYQAVSLGTLDPTLSSSFVKEQERQAKAMSTEAIAIESIISRINVPNALNMAIDVQRHEADYLLHGKDVSSDQFDKSLTALLNAFSNSSILQEHKNELVKAAIKYNDAFKSLVKNDTSILNLSAQLDQTASTLLAGIEKATPKTAAKSVPGPDLSFTAESNQLVLITAGAGLLVILLGLIVAIMLGNAIAAPITSMTQILRRIVRDQDFSVEIPVTGKNEIGLLAVELNNLLRLQQNSSSQVLKTSSSLSSETNEIAELTAAVNSHVQMFSNVNNQLIDNISDQGEITDLFQTAIHKLNNVTDTFSQFSSKPVEQNEPLGDAPAQDSSSFETTLESIKAITESSSQISDIINLSTDIAEQTNLLALNATVKAARAGAHGKEFSLIADEIAKLSQRSEEVAKEARQLTFDLTSKIEESARTAENFKNSMDQVKGTVQADFLPPEDLSRQAEAIATGTDQLKEVLGSFTTVIETINSCAREQSKEATAALEALSMLLEKTSPMENSPHRDYDEPYQPGKDIPPETMGPEQEPDNDSEVLASDDPEDNVQAAKN